MDQAKPENQGVLRHLQECRAHPDLDRLNGLSPVNFAEVAQHRGLGPVRTQPADANHVAGAHQPLGGALSQRKDAAAPIVFVQCGCRLLIL